MSDILNAVTRVVAILTGRVVPMDDIGEQFDEADHDIGGNELDTKGLEDLMFRCHLQFKSQQIEGKSMDHRKEKRLRVNT